MVAFFAGGDTVSTSGHCAISIAHRMGIAIGVLIIARNATRTSVFKKEIRVEPLAHQTLIVGDRLMGAYSVGIPSAWRNG